MPRFALKIEYDGQGFCGWQKQSHCLSVQEVVETALLKLTATPIRVHIAGRTDTGVHALGQVAHCDLDKDIPDWKVSEALNFHMRPHKVSIIAAKIVDEDFHARFSAEARHYQYRIKNRRAPLALEAGQYWQMGQALSVDTMARAAGALIGRHDFSTFRDSQCQADSPIRTLDRLELVGKGEDIFFNLSARSFLHRQVRSIVGSLVEVGRGKWPAEKIAQILAAKDRSACGPVAPPDGLYLTGVDYPAKYSFNTE